MFIIVSGVNCAGKSSLCKKFLQDNLNYLTHHFENPKDEQDGKNQYYTFLDNYDENKNYIMNTLHQQINRKNLFNNKGKIDIIIEE
jgi:guanylate kinase